MVGQPQTVQVPNYSGVNIQIFNPSVNAPGASPAPQNINAPSYTTVPAQAYPQNYYVQNLNPANQQQQQQQQQILQAPAQQNQTSTAPVSEKKKTEKRDIVVLTDDYIKSLENYLNSKDVKVRLMGAKEVLARLKEDDERKTDLALNALINKMLQDPSQQVKFLALAALNSKVVSGDQLTVNLLQNIQQQKTAYGDDAAMASQILLKMSGNTVKKEFEVKDSPENLKKVKRNNV